MAQQGNIRSGRPEGTISVVRQLSSESCNDKAFYSFEHHIREIAVVRNQSRYYVQVTEDICCAEANGRPVSSHTEHYYAVADADVPDLTALNWKEKVTRPPAYMDHQHREGTL